MSHPSGACALECKPGDCISDHLSQPLSPMPLRVSPMVVVTTTWCSSNCSNKQWGGRSKGVRRGTTHAQLLASGTGAPACCEWHVQVVAMHAADVRFFSLRRSCSGGGRTSWRGAGSRGWSGSTQRGSALRRADSSGVGSSKVESLVRLTVRSAGSSEDGLKCRGQYQASAAQ